jgi:RNA polymerase sigma-70 factor (ECF subfamily)
LADHYRTQDVRVALEQVAEPISDELDPEDAYALQERVLDVINSLGNLREDYQEVIRLRVVLELPTATTAMWMDRSPGAIRVLLHRALVALREDVDG